MKGFGDNLTQVDFFSPLPVGKEICLSSDLNAAVGSLICLLLLAPPEACRLTRLPITIRTRQTFGWGGRGGRKDRQMNEVRIYVDMYAYPYRGHTESFRCPHTQRDADVHTAA